MTLMGQMLYCLAYAYIVWRTLRGEFSIGDLTFLAGSFRRLRTLLKGLLASFSSTAGQALYLDDLFSFLRSSRKFSHQIIRVRFRAQSGAASYSRTSASGIPAPSDGRYAISA